MHTRSTCLIAAVAVLSVVPLAAGSQTDTSLKLSTTNAAAATEFRAGVSDFQNVSFESAASHFKAAIDANPNFGLARVLYANTSALNPAQQNTELSRGVVDAARATNNELVLAAAYREAALGHTDAASALFRAASQLMPADELLAWSAAGGFGMPLAATRDFVTRHPNYPLGYNTLAYQAWSGGDRAAALAREIHPWFIAGPGWCREPRLQCRGNDDVPPQRRFPLDRALPFAFFDRPP